MRCYATRDGASTTRGVATCGRTRGALWISLPACMPNSSLQLCRQHTSTHTSKRSSLQKMSSSPVAYALEILVHRLIGRVTGFAGRVMYPPQTGVLDMLLPLRKRKVDDAEWQKSVGGLCREIADDLFLEKPRARQEKRPRGEEPALDIRRAYLSEMRCAPDASRRYSV